MPTLRWLSPLVLPRVLALVLIIGLAVVAAPSAQAQVFRPRSPKAVTTRTASAAPVAAAVTPAKKPAPTGAAASATAKPAVKSNPTRRAGAKKKRGKPRADDDTVVIDDEEEDEDVKITDD